MVCQVFELLYGCFSWCLSIYFITNGNSGLFWLYCRTQYSVLPASGCHWSHAWFFRHTKPMLLLFWHIEQYTALHHLICRRISLVSLMWPHVAGWDRRLPTNSLCRHTACLQSKRGPSRSLVPTSGTVCRRMWPPLHHCRCSDNAWRQFCSAAPIRTYVSSELCLPSLTVVLVVFLYLGHYKKFYDDDDEGLYWPSIISSCNWAFWGLFIGMQLPHCIPCLPIITAGTGPLYSSCLRLLISYLTNSDDRWSCHYLPPATSGVAVPAVPTIYTHVMPKCKYHNS